MKKSFISITILLVSLVAEPNTGSAQVILATIIKAVVNKVIEAADLEVQRQQTQTIELQSAQRLLENAMAQSELGEITSWVEQEEGLFSEYYQELRQVKGAISGIAQVMGAIQKQQKLVQDYQSTFELFSQNSQFSPTELADMDQVYSGILNESLRNLNQLQLVISDSSTEMTDAKRIEIIHEAVAGINQEYTDLEDFNNQNIQLSLQRARDKNDLQTIQQLYGIQNQ